MLISPCRNVRPIIAACLLVVSSCHAAKADAATALPAIQAASLNVPAVSPGKVFKLTYNWTAVPMSADHAVFVHFVNDAGATAFQDDHDPPKGTSIWSGPFSYSRTILVPETMPEGNYKIVAGVYGSAPGGKWINYPLAAGAGAKAGADNSFEIGTVKIDLHAPDPPLDSDRPATLDLTGYKVTFEENFKTGLNVSAWGPGTRWIAHTPWGGDFGDAQFTDPGPDSPFSIKDGMLQIEARKDSTGKWHGGLLAGVDPQGHGFSQAYGYFEMCAKFPKGLGTWPAFWLCNTKGITDKKRTNVELDVVEQYGLSPVLLHNTLHLWGPNGFHTAQGNQSFVKDMTKDFHRYGLLWTRKDIVWYFDGVEMFRQPTPPEADSEMYMMVNLALGSGWPIDKTPNPSDMLVKYVRSYARPDGENTVRARTAAEVADTPGRPETIFQINCGGGLAGTWVPDGDVVDGTPAGAAGSTSPVDLSHVANPAPQIVYQSVHYGNMTYTIPNLRPGKRYTVNLHMMEGWYAEAGKRKFDVAINGKPVLNGFDIFAEAGGKDVAIMKSFAATADSAGRIAIQFTNVVDNASVCGIEVTE